MAELLSRSFLRATLDALSAHIAILDEDGSILAVNREWERFQTSNGCDNPVPDVGRPYFWAVDPAGRDAEYAETARKGLDDVRLGRTNEFEMEYPCLSNGELLYFRMRVTRFTDEGKVRLVVAHEEITAQKRAQQMLEQSNADLSAFATMAAHDLNEPLRKILSGMDILQARYSTVLDADGQELIIMMQQSTVRMQDLLNTLLDYARINRQPSTLQIVDLNLTLENVLSDLSPVIQEKKAQVKVGTLPLAQGHMTLLHQLFQNLVSNALKYQQPGKPPVISVEALPSQHDGYVCIAVTDDGIGFNEEQAEKIFNMFTRLNPKSEYAGLGLGLATCKRIVETHNGSIKAYSKPGEGSRFIVTLPAAG